MSDEVVENDTVTADEAVTEVVDERSDVERERDEYLDALQRLQADFENYRKRVARSSMDAADRAAGEVVVKMLPVLDAFDLAAAHFSSGALRRGRGVGSGPGDFARRPVARGTGTHRRRGRRVQSPSARRGRARRGRGRSRGRPGVARRVPVEGCRTASSDGESSRLTRWSNASGSIRTTTRFLD